MTSVKAGSTSVLGVTVSVSNGFVLECHYLSSLTLRFYPVGTAEVFMSISWMRCIFLSPIAESILEIALLESLIAFRLFMFVGTFGVTEIS